MSERQLGLLDAREETGDAFDERERAAPALAEAVTVLTGGTPQVFGSGGGFVPDEVHARAAKHFDDVRLARLIRLITVINGWNRLMVARRIPRGSAEW